MDILAIVDGLKSIVENQVFGTAMVVLGATGLGGYLVTKAYVWILRLVEKKILAEIISSGNQEKIANKIDDAIDMFQVKNQEAGRESRRALVSTIKALISTLNVVIKRLNEDDGVN